MPTIVFVSPKGGAGKTTSALVLAEQIARSAPVTVIDADPNHPIQTWAAGPNTPANLSVVAHADEENVIDVIEEAAARTPFVLVDLEGTAAKIVLLAVSQADLVIVPTQGSQLDAAQASRALRVIKQGKLLAKPFVTLPVDLRDHGLTPAAYGSLIALNGVLIFLLQPPVSRLLSHLFGQHLEVRSLSSGHRFPARGGVCLSSELLALLLIQSLLLVRHEVGPVLT